MKIIKYAIFMVVLTVLSCMEKEQKFEYAIITGKFTNTKGGELTIQSSSGFKRAVRIRDDGSLADTLDIADGYYIIRYGKVGSGLYIEKGSLINITADETNFIESLAFSGDYSELNNYYAERSRVDYKFRHGIKEYCEKEENEFVNLILSDKKLLEDKFELVSYVPHEIKVKEKRHLVYNYLEKKYMYKTFYHSKFAGKEDYVASENFMKDLKEIPVDRPEDYQYSSAYSYLINVLIIDPKAYQIYEEDSSNNFLSAYNKSVLQLENVTLRDLVIFDYVRGTLPEVKDKKVVYDNFIKITSNTETKNKITELYNYVLRLEPGKPSPLFENYENYSGGTMSLESLRGTYVYIDVWATWCKPCIREIPFLQEIEKKYRGKNIEFVSISIDNKKDYNNWKKMVDEKQMSGTQLFADRAYNSDFIKAYKISGIPQFILIDPQGNIVSSNAPKPSDNKLIDLFNGLNI
ncbi:TlpA disulfide reductase family protein [Gaetbulibacter sp. M235]|uniref:TlpA family protein disulfide reductase n=1 Tax=Gaetbulibacter sp. M235 TaxID=3126510 RepID=UPI00374F0EEB